MEFKTKYNPGDTVHFMFDNKAVTGEINFVWVGIGFDKKAEQPTVKVTYKVHHKWKIETESTNTGFMASDKNREKYFDLDESIVFSTKEELLKSL